MHENDTTDGPTSDRSPQRATTPARSLLRPTTVLRRDVDGGAQARDPRSPVRRGCASAFDRWSCTLPSGHEGNHVAVTDGSRTQWNGPATGRRLRDL